MVVLGAASPFLGMDISGLTNAIREIFRKKGESVVDLNLRALETGRKFAEEERKKLK
jgi:indolepyruvate ferredoxin oxidoreductase beta subunit